MECQWIHLNNFTLSEVFLYDFDNGKSSFNSTIRVNRLCTWHENKLIWLSPRTFSVGQISKIFGDCLFYKRRESGQKVVNNQCIFVEVSPFVPNIRYILMWKFWTKLTLFTCSHFSCLKWNERIIFLKRFICLVEVHYHKVNLNSDNKMFLHVKLIGDENLTCKNILLSEFKLTLW